MLLRFCCAKKCFEIKNCEKKQALFAMFLNAWHTDRFRQTNYQKCYAMTSKALYRYIQSFNDNELLIIEESTQRFRNMLYKHEKLQNKR